MTTGGGWSSDHARVAKRPPIEGGQTTTLQGQNNHRTQGEYVQGKASPSDSESLKEGARDYLQVLRGGRQKRGTYPGLFRKTTEQSESVMLHDLALWSLKSGKVTPRDVGRRIARFKLEYPKPEFRLRVTQNVALTYGISTENDSPDWRKLRHAISSQYSRACRVGFENVCKLITQRLSLLQKGDSNGVIRELSRFRMEAA